ncbi:MAG: hypothetical protein JWO02_1982 [Solirubrobacterales bacterium]|nr:hypothetical protein [Solirubrobacterales bacterium]
MEAADLAGRGAIASSWAGPRRGFSPTLLPVAVAAVVATLYLLIAPPSADLAAQTYRADVFSDHGFILWDNGWYAGHHVPGYSLLFPPLGGILGVRLAGAFAALAAAALASQLAHRQWGDRALAGALWFAVGSGGLLLTGRMTYLLGVAVALASLAALQADRPRASGALAALACLASPVAGLFLGLSVAAWGAAAPERRRRALAVGTAALLPALLMTILFPEGGDPSFTPSVFWPAIAATATVGLALPREERVLRIGVGLYAATCVTTFLIANPLGGNVCRLGELAAGPLLVCTLRGRMRTRTLIALVLPLAVFQISPPLQEVRRGIDDPSLQPTYYTGLARFLTSRPEAGGFRVEVPFTRNHWEAAILAKTVPLARGWERQLDRRYGPLFYDGRFDAARYRAWLGERAVRYVALPDVALDTSGEAEATLLRRPPAWLRPVWHDAHWHVWAVSGATPLMTGVPGSSRLTLSGFVLRARGAGTAMVRVHDSRWWKVTAGEACASAAPNGMTRVQVRAPGTIRISARMTGSACAG